MSKMMKTKCKQKWNKSTFTLIICLILPVRVAQLDITFSKVKKPELTLQTTTPAVKASGVLDCARQCTSQKFDSFTFDKVNGQCIMGTCIVDTGSVTAKEFYLSCNTKDGFELLSDGTIKACVWVSPYTNNYTTARDDCKARDAHLYTVKSLRKLQLLQARYTELIWVGMNDLVEEGTYVWEDDGSVCDETCRAPIFVPNEPDNSQGVEDCILYDPNRNYFLNDGMCIEKLIYICEKPCFQML